MKVERTLISMDGKSTSVPKYTIRHLVLSDSPAIMYLLGLFGGETTQTFYNRDYVEYMVEQVLGSEEGIALGLFVDDAAVGLIIGAVGVHSFNPDKTILNEMAWYVHKDHRGTISSIKLLKEFERLGRDQGAEYCALSVRSNLKDVDTLYQRLGYHEEERTYLRKL